MLTAYLRVLYDTCTQDAPLTIHDALDAVNAAQTTEKNKSRKLFYQFLADFLWRKLGDVNTMLVQKLSEDKKDEELQKMVTEYCLGILDSFVPHPSSKHEQDLDLAFLIFLQDQGQISRETMLGRLRSAHQEEVIRPYVLALQEYWQELDIRGQVSAGVINRVQQAIAQEQSPVRRDKRLVELVGSYSLEPVLWGTDQQAANRIAEHIKILIHPQAVTLPLLESMKKAVENGAHPNADHEKNELLKRVYLLAIGILEGSAQN